MKDQNNPDSTTSTPHDEHGQPIGTAAGGLSGAATGAAMGAAGGPVGAVIGGVAGAIVGGLTGKGVEKVAQSATVDPAAHDAYWEQNHSSQSYAAGGTGYEPYRSAYRTGYEGARAHGSDQSFAEAETTLKGSYERARDAAGLGWEEARHATRAAYERAAEELRVVLHEEQLRVGKREVEEGAVHIRKTVSTEQVSVPVELRREEATIERIPASELQGVSAAGAFQEQTLEVKLTAEEAVVAKDTVVTGAVRIRKDAHTETQTVSDTVRKEDVEVEHGAAGTTPTTGTTTHRTDETTRR